MISKTLFNSIWLGGIFLLSSCSSHIPPEIKQPIEGSPTVEQVRNNLDNYRSQKVRWGGIILETENKQKASWLKIIALPLDEDGQPRKADHSSGRFIAIVDEFLEPEVFNVDRKITITGQVIRFETLNVGEFSYDYPVIQVDHYYLWPAEIDTPYYDYPPYWWHDPYYPWPYLYYPHRSHRH